MTPMKNPVKAITGRILSRAPNYPFSIRDVEAVRATPALLDEIARLNGTATTREVAQILLEGRGVHTGLNVYKLTSEEAETPTRADLARAIGVTRENVAAYQPSIQTTRRRAEAALDAALARHAAAHSELVAAQAELQAAHEAWQKAREA